MQRPTPPTLRIVNVQNGLAYGVPRTAPIGPSSASPSTPSSPTDRKSEQSHGTNFRVFDLIFSKASGLSVRV